MASASRKRIEQTLPSSMPRLIAVMAISALSGCATTCAGPEVTGELAGKRIQTAVDSETAVDYLVGRATCPENLDPRNRDALAELAARQSVDAAAICFTCSIIADRENRELQRRFRHAIAVDPTRPQDTPFECRDCLFLFVPGFHYRSSPETGADLSGPRRMLRRQNLRTLLIEVEETGTVAANARRITSTVRSLSTADHRLFLISASKGGPDVAEALGRLLSPAETRHIAAWINIGGILAGTRLADVATSWLMRSAISVLGLIEGYRLEGIKSLTTPVSRRRLANQAIPSHIQVINYVSVPMTGDITPRGRLGYRLLRSRGPNDGLTLLSDAIALGGCTILEPGEDHFLAGVDASRHGLALLRAILEAEGKKPDCSARTPGRYGYGE